MRGSTVEMLRHTRGHEVGRGNQDGNARDCRVLGYTCKLLDYSNTGSFDLGENAHPPFIAKMDDPASNDELLQMFMAVTGCQDASTALHFLEAHNHDINQATNDYLEHGAPSPIPVDDDDTPLPITHSTAQTLRMPNIVDSHDRHPEQYVDLTAAEPDAGNTLNDLHTLAAYRAARVNPQDPDDEANDDSTLPATRPRGPRRRTSSARRRVSLMDDEMYNMHDGDYELLDADGIPTAVRPPSHPPLCCHHPPQHHSGMHLPADIDVEEARMLEAAILGIPYEGEIPPHRLPLGTVPSASLDPAAIEQRLLRQEQDDAYEQSLQADRAKAEAAAAKQREAQAAAAKQEADAAQLQRLLSNKEAGMPLEPAEGEDGAITVLVRLPGGGRCGFDSVQGF